MAPRVLRDIPAEAEPTVAVLIDADNTPPGAIKHILDASAKYGRTIIKRAYGDWTVPTLQPWGVVFRDFAVQPVQQFQYTRGKNSTDIAMIIDALDLLHERRVDVFVLVTSDSDFTALATRIREDAVTVVGVGRNTTPSSFVKGCDQFIPIETMVTFTQEGEESPPSSGQDIRPIEREKIAEVEAEGKDLLTRAAKQAADAEGIIRGANLGVILKRLDPRFAPSNYGARRLSDFIALFPDVLVRTGKFSGLDPTYKLMIT